MEEMISRQLSWSRHVTTVVLFLVTVLPVVVYGHGRLIDPPARNSMWRFGFDNPVNYNDNELYCGGRMVQWLKNGGKCGVCGDSYHGDRPHEAGGKFANGIISKTYEEGSEMYITVHLTANHLGFFEFRICPQNDHKSRVKQSCLDKYLMERADGQGTRFYVPKGKYNAMFNYTLKLPRGLTCNQCVVQWKYRTGNTWDKEPDSGRFCLGCGPQEEFYNCADVSIEPRRPAVIEYPTSQPDPPRYLPTIDLPTVKPTARTARQTKSIYTRAPTKGTTKKMAHAPPIMPPQPPPRKPLSESRPISQENPNSEGVAVTSIFTTPRSWRRKSKKTTTHKPIKTTKSATRKWKTKSTTTRATWKTTTGRPVTTTERRRHPPSTRITTTTTTTQQPTTTTTQRPTTTTTTTHRPTTTTTTTKRPTTTTTTSQLPSVTTTTTKRTTTTAMAATKAWERSRRTTQKYVPRKSTRIYTVFERRTWEPTTSQLGLKITPEKPRNPFEYLKTKPTVKSPFHKPTSRKYKYWTARPFTDRPKYRTRAQPSKRYTQPTTTTTSEATTTTRKSTTTQTTTTTTEPRTTTTTTQATTTTTERPTTTMETPTVTWRSDPETVMPPETTAWVKWWTNKPDPTTTATPVTRRPWTSPSLWWPPIWLPWTRWTDETSVPQTTTPVPTTTEMPPKTAEMFYPTEGRSDMKEGEELVKISNREFVKIGSSESLPWYVGGDLTWKTWSPAENTVHYHNDVTETPDDTERGKSKTTEIPCIHSTTPGHTELHRDGVVKSKSPFQPPRPVRRWTYPPIFTPKTPPVWFRTVQPPVAQPVQPPPPSHHIWVKKNVRTCRAIIPLAVGMNDWCFVNCNSGFCPTKFCYCDNKHRRPRYRYRTKKPPLWWKEAHNSRARTRPRFQNRKRLGSSPRDHQYDRERAIQNIKQNMYKCRGIGKYSGRSEFDDWCQTNCRSVLCPLLICGCTWR